MQFHFDRYEQTSAQEALDYRLTFGKHRSTTLGELGGNWEGRNYLRYLTTTTNMDPVVQAFIGAALENTPDERQKATTKVVAEKPPPQLGY